MIDEAVRRTATRRDLLHFVFDPSAGEIGQGLLIRGDSAVWECLPEAHTC